MLDSDVQVVARPSQTKQRRRQIKINLVLKKRSLLILIYSVMVAKMRMTVWLSPWWSWRWYAGRNGSKCSPTTGKEKDIIIIFISCNMYVWWYVWCFILFAHFRTFDWSKLNFVWSLPRQMTSRSAQVKLKDIKASYMCVLAITARIDTYQKHIYKWKHTIIN